MRVPLFDRPSGAFYVQGVTHAASGASEPLLGGLTGDVEGCADDGPGVAGGARVGDGLPELFLTSRDGLACGHNAPETGGVSGWVASGVEIVEARFIGMGALKCHVGHLISDSRKTWGAAGRHG